MKYTIGGNLNIGKIRSDLENKNNILLFFTGSLDFVLEELDFLYSNVSGIELINSNVKYDGLENFKNLATFVSESEYRYFFQIMPSIKEVGIAWNTYYKNSFFNAFPNIERLFIRYFKEKNCCGIGSFERLKELTLTQGGVSTVKGLSSCSRLERIELNYLRNLINIDSLSGMEFLKSIDMESIPKIDRIDIKEVPSLKKVSLYKLKSLKNLKINIADNTLEEIKLIEIPSLEEDDFIYHHAQSIKSLLIGKSLHLMPDISLFKSITRLSVDVKIYDLDFILSNKNIEYLGLVNELINFLWLTENHKMRRMFVKFRGGKIDWNKIFQLKNLEFVSIECLKKINETSDEEIREIAKSYGKSIGHNITPIKKRYPFYYFSVYPYDVTF